MNYKSYNGILIIYIGNNNYNINQQVMYIILDQFLSLQCANLLLENNAYTRLTIKFSEGLTEFKLSLPNISNKISLVSVVPKEAAQAIKKIRASRQLHTLLIKTIQAYGIMVGICETSNDLNGWSNIRKLLKLRFINNLIQFEARYIPIILNVEKLLAKKYFGMSVIWMIQKN